MAYTTAGKNAMLDHLASEIGYVSAHTANPGNSGANEVSGGGYARAAIAMGSASGGAIDSSSVPTLTIPASTTVTHLAVWDSATGGVCLAYKDVDAETYGSAGTMDVTDADFDLNS